MKTADSPRATVSSVAPDHGAKAPAPDAALLDDLVVANRILFDQGVVDAFGHVSVRHDKAADRFLLARNMLRPYIPKGYRCQRPARVSGALHPQ